MTGRELQELREVNGITQQRLADASGVPKGTISRIEANPDVEISKARVVSALLSVLKNEPKINAVSDQSELIESLREIIRSKDETVKALRDQIEYLKDRLSQYEDKPKTGTN